MSNDALNRKSWYEIAGSAAKGQSPEGEGPLAAHAAPSAIRKHENTASGGKAHVGRGLSWRTRVSRGLDIPENLPAGASLSPRGDVGLLRGTEAIAACPDIKKMRSSVMQASTYLPAPKELS